MTRRRCAIYTRKSTEEGLDRAFNSLDAQREACEAFIVSQRHEGWQLVRKAYDDGGFSGGSMDRPALQALMEDVSDGLVDVIVVYKIDRLTRSLADFAKMVEVFEPTSARSPTRAMSIPASKSALYRGNCGMPFRPSCTQESQPTDRHRLQVIPPC